MDRFTRILLFAALLLAGCQPALTPTPTAAPTRTPLPPTATLAPTATVTPAPTPTATEKPYDTTEFDGIFSEKYYPDLYQHDFLLKDEETETEISMSFGLTSGSPYTDFELSQIGNDYAADYFLAACNYRKNVTNGNGEMEDADTFAKKVANGEVWIEVPYTDEITGEDKIGNYNLKNGLSVVLVYNAELLKNMFPKSSSYESNYYITLNKNGRLIIVKEGNLEGYMNEYNQYVLSGKKSLDYINGAIPMAEITRIFGIYGVVTNDNYINNGGYVKNPDPEPLIDIKEKLVNNYGSIIDPQKNSILGSARSVK